MLLSYPRNQPSLLSLTVSQSSRFSILKTRTVLDKQGCLVILQHASVGRLVSVLLQPYHMIIIWLSCMSSCISPQTPRPCEMTILLSLSRYTVRGDVSITESSDLRGGIGSLWSVNEGALGMWVQGLEMEPGKTREERKRRNWDKGHFCRRHQQASYPLIILGKWAENPWLNIWPLQKCPFPPLGAWMGSRVTSVEGWVFLFILSVCMLVVGVWLCLMRSKDIIDVNIRHQTLLLIIILSTGRKACARVRCSVSSVTAGVSGTHGEHMLGSTGLLLFDLNHLYSQSLRLCGSNCSVEVSALQVADTACNSLISSP